LVQNNLIIETKFKIQELKRQFAQNSVFTTSELVDFYSKYEPYIPRATVNWRVYELVKQGVIDRIGKGKFKLGQSVFFIPEIPSKIFKINKTIKTNFPFLLYCIWPQQWINEFSQHISNSGLILVEIERDSAESVYHHLKEFSQSVFYKPGKEFLQDYIHGIGSALLVRHLVTEAPVQIVQGVPTVSIEKLLVDISCDPEFEYLRGRETGHIFENAFNRYSVNRAKLLRYANRKKKKIEIMEIIERNNLI